MKQKKRGRRERGAVTVFLTLILVPCIIFVCAFGDVSRVELSRSQAEAVGDLALYSLLAHYDEELKEWYGLVASCQSIDEFYDVTENYFVGMLNANGIDGSASKALVSYLSAARNGDFSNFLQLDGLDEVKAEAVPDSSMGSNPALIEDGIVEFMKYRGPVVIVENIIDRFQLMDFTDVTESKDNEPIIEAKKAYAEAEGEMMNDLLHTYLAIRKYVDYRIAHDVPDMYKYQSTYTVMLKNMYEDFGRMTELITQYYVATQGMIDLTAQNGRGYFPQYTLPGTHNLSNDTISILFPEENQRFIYRLEGGVDESGSDCGIGAVKIDGEYYMDQAAVRKLVENVDMHITELRDVDAKAVRDACWDLHRSRNNGNTNQAIYCMQMQRLVRTGETNRRMNDLHNHAKALMQTYAKLILALQCAYESDAEAVTCAEIIKTNMDKIKQVYDDYLSPAENPQSEFEQIVSGYQGIVRVQKDMVAHRDYTFESKLCGVDLYSGVGKQVTVAEFLAKVKEELKTNILDHLNQQIEYVDVILNGGTTTYGGNEYPVSSLDQIRQKVVNYSEARDNWGEEANSKSTKYAAEEQAEYSGLDSSGTLSATLYEDGGKSVDEMKTRTLNIKKDMETVRDLIESITYGGYKVYEIGTENAIICVQDLVPKTGTDSTNNLPIYDVSLYRSQNTEAAKGYHAQLMTDKYYDAIRLIAGPAGNDPDLDEEKNQPALYKFMKDAFPLEDLEQAAEETERQRDANQKNTEDADRKAEESQKFNRNFVLGLGEADPIERDGYGSFGIGSAIEGFVDTIKLLANCQFDEFRDKLYVCAYIMEMFSYSSYNNEGQFKLYDKDSKPGYKDFVNGKYNNADIVSLWENDDATVITDNKSLTNRMINAKNNRSNLAEVEYILYGKATNQENLEEAYKDIFAIRMALNTVAGFANFYTPKPGDTTGAAITSAATAIAAATMGVIPPPVTKVVLIGILATLESVHDLDLLRAGQPVALYKTTDTWRIGLPSGGDIADLISGDGGLGDTPPDKNGFFYSDYILCFLIINCNSSSKYTGMLLRIGDLIEGNMVQGGEAGFDLEKSKCYFQLTGDVAVKPLLLDIPLVLNYSGDEVNDVLKAKGWCSYSLDIVRGYS